MDDNDLIDIGYVGYPFTWNNKRGGRANIRMRLDRAIVNPRWRMTKEACGNIVRACWAENFVDSRWYCIQQKLRLCRRKLRHWRANQQLNSQSRMKELQDQLVHEFEKDDFDATQYSRIEEGMRQATAEEEEYWRLGSPG